MLNTDLKPNTGNLYMSEKIGRHKGAVETLLHEKKELSRILNIVNSQLERHLQELEEAGVDTDAFIDSLLDEEKESGDGSEDRGNSRKGKDSDGDRVRGQNDNNRSRNTSDKSSGSGSSRDFSPSR